MNIKLTFILLQISLNLFSQKYINIRGHITDAESGKPLSFVSISIQGVAVGTVSNSDGDFVFHIPNKYSNDSLVFSCIGYELSKAKVDDCIGKNLKIRLKEKFYALDEVKVKPKDALEIIKEAVAKIPKNYPQQPINMDGFYRELTFENDTCVEMAEAACKFYYRPYGEEIDLRRAIDEQYLFNSESRNDYYDYFFGFQLATNPDDTVEIIEARGSNILHKHRFKVIPKNGPLSLECYDLAKTKGLYLARREFNRYEYTLSDIVSFQGRQAYVIEIKPIKKRTLEGKTYIDIETLAFIGFEFTIPQGEDIWGRTTYWTPALYKKKRRKCADDEYSLGVTLKVLYKQVENKWYLNSIRKEEGFKYIFSEHYIYKEKEPFIKYNIYRELLINNVSDEVTEIDKNKSLTNTNESYLYDFDLNYNEDFWKNYNVIVANKMQDSIMEQLQVYEPIDKQFKAKFEVDTTMPAPVAPISKNISYTRLEDDYYWMQDIKNPDVLNYIHEENEYTENYMLPLKQMQRNLYFEQLNRKTKDTVISSTLCERLGYRYYYKKGERYENLYRIEIGDSTSEELVLDIDKILKNRPNMEIFNENICPDNKYISYGEMGAENFDTKLIIQEIDSKRKVDSLFRTFTIYWHRSQNVVYYITCDSTNRSDKLLKHTIGTKPEDDEIIFYEKDSTRNIRAGISDNKYLIFESINDFYVNDVYFIDLQKANSSYELIIKREKDQSVMVDIINDTIYCLANENIIDYNFYKFPVNKHEKSNWEIVVNANNGKTIESWCVLKDFIVLIEKQEMQPSINIYTKNGDFIEKLDFKEPSYSLRIWASETQQQKNKFHYTISSLQIPETKYEYDIKNHSNKKISQKQINGYDENKYRTELLWATAADGTKIPISLIYNKKLAKRNGESYLYLTTYGSYGGSTSPTFKQDYLPLIDRGVIYAIAHVRGGGELGERWHREAMQLKKKNTFGDFIACAEHLIAEKYTSQGKIIAEGASAGGLVMGAIANMRPELFNTIILQVPYVDVLGSLMNPSAKFSTVSQGEEGNPNEPEVYEYIKSYSPYQNIKAQDYPNMLYYIGLNDDRVEYWQTLKSIAKLRALRTDHNKLYLKTELYAGHNGYYGEDAYYVERAFIYAFIFDNIGKKY